MALGCLREVEHCRTIVGNGTSADTQLAVFEQAQRQCREGRRVARRHRLDRRSDAAVTRSGRDFEGFLDFAGLLRRVAVNHAARRRVGGRSARAPGQLGAIGRVADDDAAGSGFGLRDKFRQLLLARRSWRALRDDLRAGHEIVHVLRDDAEVRPDRRSPRRRAQVREHERAKRRIAAPKIVVSAIRHAVPRGRDPIAAAPAARLARRARSAGGSAGTACRRRLRARRSGRRLRLGACFGRGFLVVRLPAGSSNCGTASGPGSCPPA